MKMKSILDFENEFDVIKDLISPKTLFKVDDKLNLLQQLRRSLLERKEYLQEKVALVSNIVTYIPFISKKYFRIQKYVKSMKKSFLPGNIFLS